MVRRSTWAEPCGPALFVCYRGKSVIFLGLVAALPSPGQRSQAGTTWLLVADHAVTDHACIR
eukprot:328395-Chlamydomonas_euryale.AAC.2